MVTQADREREKRMGNNPGLQAMIQRGIELQKKGARDEERIAAQAEKDDAERALRNKRRREKRAAQRASTELIRGARLALAEKVLEAVSKETAETNKRFFEKLGPSAAQRSKEALVRSAEEKGRDFDRIAQRGEDIQSREKLTQTAKAMDKRLTRRADRSSR